MVGGREFQTVGAATLKPREAKVVRTRGTDNKLVLAERREQIQITFIISTALRARSGKGLWQELDSYCPALSLTINLEQIGPAI